MMIKEPLKVKNTVFNNRIVMPPMACGKADDGRVNASHLQYYTRRCGSGHIGLVITEHMYVHPTGKASPGQISIADDESVPGLSALTSAIHEGGAKCFAQISHAGYKAMPEPAGTQPVGPSPERLSLKNGDIGLSHELSRDEIKEIISSFSAAALRAKKAGYDGVEIHSAHGYLLCQFYSPLSNRRSDEYGCGSVENRVRLQLEVIRAVREVVGEDYPIAIRMGGCDYVPGGSTIDDCVEACRLFEKAGIDIIDLSGGHCGSTPPWLKGVRFEDMALAVKAAVDVPVILTGGIADGETAQRLLEEKACDMVGIGRGLLRDPDWAEHEIYR